MRQIKSMRHARFGCAVVVIGSVCCWAHAADQIWEGDGGDDNWTTTDNWTGGVVPAVGDQAVFGDSVEPGPTAGVFLNINPTVDSVRFEGAVDYTMNTGQLNLAMGNITVLGGTTTHTINSSVRLLSPGDWDIAAGNTLSLAGALTDSGAMHLLTKAGAGTLILSGSNGTFLGDIVIEDGTIEFGPSDSLSSDTDVDIKSGATLRAFSGETMGGIKGAGSLVIDAELRVNEGGQTTDFAGTITGAANLVKDGLGTLTLSGDNSGFTGSIVIEGGTLAINAGGTSSSTLGRIGVLPGGTAAATIDTGTWNNSGDLDVGSQGTGTLTVNAGGTVSNTFGHIGNQPGSTGTATIDGGTWNNSSFLRIGSAGNATLTVTNGGNLTNTDSVIGRLFGSTGTTTIDAATWTNSGFLTVADSGTATLTIDNGGTVSNTLGRIGNSPSGTGTATINNGTWNNTTGLYVGGSDIASGGTGTLNVNTGANLNVTGPLRVWSPTGTLNHNGGTITVNDGDFDPTPGEYDIDGPDNPTLVLNNATFTTAAADLNIGRTDTQSGTLTINADTTVTNAIGRIGRDTGSTGTVNVNNAGTWNNPNFLYVGEAGTGTLNINTGGTVTSVNAHIADQPNSTGTVNVDAGTWNSSGTIVVSLNGTGTMNLSNGATVSAVGNGHIGLNPNSTGTANINDGTWTTGHTLYVGNFGTGTLNINTDGTVSNGTGVIANISNSSGTANIDGGTWSNTFSLTVGESGTGTLNINTTGTASNTIGIIANGSNSTGSANIDGGTWNNSESLTVGASGTGTLNINTTGTVSNTDGVIGHIANSIGTANINSGTWTNSESLTIGNFSTGTMNLTNGATVTNTTGTIANAANSTGTANINDGTWTNSGDLFIGLSGTGTLTVNAAGTVTNTIARIGANPDGTGTATIDGGTWNNTDKLRVGVNGNGTLNVKNGGIVTSAIGQIGLSPGSTGTANINNGTWTNTDSLAVGLSGTGTLNVLPNALVQVTNDLSASPTGTINLSGGTITTNTLTLDPAATFNFNAGTLNFTTDTNIDNPLAAQTIGPATTLAITGTATLIAPLTLDGGTFSAESLSNPALLQFNTGTFKLTNDDLNITAPGTFGPTIQLTNNQHINVANNTNVAPEGLLELTGGSFTTNDLANNGIVRIAGLTSALNGNTITNHALLFGDGRINAQLNNQTTGEVQASGPAPLIFTAAGNTNDGLISMIDGQINFIQGMTNNGIATLTGTQNLLSGTINNQPAARINVAGTSEATFFGPLTNNGDVFIGAGSTATFAGTVSGSGNYPGPGTAEFTDGFTPGSSPGINNFGGNLVLGPFADLTIEAQATTTTPVPGLGNDHDQINITANVTLDGTLNIAPLTNAGPIEDTPYGNEYLAMTYGTRTPSTFFHTINGSLINTAFALAPLLDESTNEFILRATIPGDLNLDNKVSVADLSTFALNFGSTPGLYDELENKNSWQLGDFNTDGAITVADLSLLALNFGFDASDPTATPLGLSASDLATLAGIDPSSIPEPTTAYLLLATGLILTRSDRLRPHQIT